MLIWLNGETIEEASARARIDDRGFLYGDGLFETIRAYQGHLFRFDWHWNRLQAGANVLRLTLPMNQKEASQRAGELLEKNHLTEAVVRFQLTRGPGQRGDSIQGAHRPTFLITCHQLPAPCDQLEAGWRLAVASQRVPSFNPLRRFKTCNRLTHILARLEAEQNGAHEAILLNEKDHVVEAAAANLFWLDQGVVYTPSPSTGLLPGITRAVVMELCDRLEIECVEMAVTIPDLLAAEAVFLTQSVRELIKVTAIGSSAIADHPLVDLLRREYRETVLRESR